MAREAPSLAGFSTRFRYLCYTKGQTDWRLLVSTIPPLDLAVPSLTFGLLAFGVAFLLILTGLIIIIETTVLQFLGWGEFRACLKAAAWMNIVSTVFGFGLLGLVPALRLWGLLIAWVLSVIIEAAMLHRLQPGNLRRAGFVSAVANLASYLILLLPAYWYGINL